MGRKAKVKDNEIVAEWLIQHRWKETLHPDIKMRMPSLVEEAVYSAVYIVAGSNNGKVNISPKLVFKALMLLNISSQTVKACEVGYDMSDRTARRLAQTARWALETLEHRVEEFENVVSEELWMNWLLEKEFVEDYNLQRESKYHSPLKPSVPDRILQLYRDGKYLEYGQAVQQFRSSK